MTDMRFTGEVWVLPRRGERVCSRPDHMPDHRAAASRHASRTASVAQSPIHACVAVTTMYLPYWVERVFRIIQLGMVWKRA